MGGGWWVVGGTILVTRVRFYDVICGLIGL